MNKKRDEFLTKQGDSGDGYYRKSGSYCRKIEQKVNYIDEPKYIQIWERLLDAFILREYADRYGILSTTPNHRAIQEYRTDPVFHARVTSAVVGVMQIITEVLDTKYDAKSKIPRL